MRWQLCAGLEISALKFYPRALEPYEIREIFTNGQPLSEVASGSALQTLDEDPLEKVRSSMQDITKDTAGAIKEQTVASTAAQMIQFAGLKESSAVKEDFLYGYLPDPSPCATLWKEEEQQFLPPRELARWQECRKCDAKQCQNADGNGGYLCYGAAGGTFECAHGFSNKLIGGPIDFGGTPIQVCLGVCWWV